MTKREMQVMGDHFTHLSDWFLSMFEKYPKEVSEMAHNELVVRKVKRGDKV